MKTNMSSILKSLLLGILSLPILFNQTFAADQLPRLAVLDLEAKYGVAKDYAEAISVIVRDEIYAYRKYSVLSKQDLAAVMSREEMLQAMGCDDGSTCLTDFGKALGSEFMVAGSISKIGPTWLISLRLLDTQGTNAGVVNRVSMDCQCDEIDLLSRIKEVSTELIGVKPSSSIKKEKSKSILINPKKIQPENEFQMLEENRKKSSFTVETEPYGATIQLLNEKGKYTPGMLLHPGRYNVEVSKEGYETRVLWLDLENDKNLNTTIRLESLSTRAQQPNKFRDSTTGMEFIYIKGGCYQMGDIFGDGDECERPVHEVCVDNFFMGKYEVTQGEYRKIMKANPSNFNFGDNYPVENVSWNEAMEFIRHLNIESKKQYRLPTEAEWEYAARSGGKIQKYSGSDDLGKVAWNKGNSGGVSHEVGQKEPNDFGLYDMTGNVLEWCNDLWDYDYYRYSPKNNPPGWYTSNSRVDRGGSWFNKSPQSRTVFRDFSRQGGATNYLGFRLVLPK